MRPFAGGARITMLDRIEMNIIAMPLKIALVSQSVFPVASLPNTTLALALAASGNLLACLDTMREECFDQPPSGRIIGVSRRERPDRVQMVGQDHDRIESEGMARTDSAKSLAQRSIRSVSKSDRRPSRLTVEKKLPPGMKLRRYAVTAGP